MEKKRLGYIPGELWRNIALEAASSGRQFRFVVEEALQEYLRGKNDEQRIWLSPELATKLNLVASNKRTTPQSLTTLAIETYIEGQAQ